MITIKHLSESDVRTLLPPQTVLLGYRGSIAHGMYVHPEDPQGIDDKDLLGVCVAPSSVYYGLDRFEQHEVMLREYDSVVYEYRKYVRLLCQANPNVLSLLWLEPNHYVHITQWAGQRLLDHRDLFSTRRIYHAFTGYAYSQLKRMTHHQPYQGYMGAKRKALVDQFGYDTKNAAHLIRLLRMGIEFLREGRLFVLRPDAAQLMEIKLGHWTLEQVKHEADHLFKRAEAAYDACQLPSEPDYERVNTFLVETLSEYFRGRVE